MLETSEGIQVTHIGHMIFDQTNKNRTLGIKPLFKYSYVIAI